MHSSFTFYTPKQLKAFTNLRKGEIKVGEKLTCLKHFNELEKHPQQFVLLGITEDVGVRANLGRPGAKDAWPVVLTALCNIQVNDFFSAENILLAGCLNPTVQQKKAALLNPSKPKDLQKLRSLTEEVDHLLSPIIQQIVECGKIPIVIGGGHNNAYGNIVGASKALQTSLACLNIDPHADFRPLEGRHSGNGFAYAYAEKALEQYYVWGLHESYNNQYILDQFKNKTELKFKSFDDLITSTFEEKDIAFKHALNWLNTPMGLELDMDCVQGFPASAQNASGFSLNELRHFTRTAAALAHPVYLHICEAAPALASHENEKANIGKSIAYLIVDFIKARG